MEDLFISSSSRRNKLLIFAILILLSFVISSEQSNEDISIRINSEDDGFTDDMCVSCPIGTYSNKDDPLSNCTHFCQDGFCPKNKTDEWCLPCRPGTYSDIYNATECQPCPSGHISAFFGQSNCTICDAGTVNNSISTLCILCDAGTKSNSSGASYCTSCLPGQFSFEGSTYCMNCEPGSYNPLEGAGQCIPCGKGKWNPERGSYSREDCLTCPDGYFCPSLTNSEPRICPKDSFCKNGASFPSACPTLFQSDQASVSCSPQTSLYVIVGIGCVLVVVILFGIIWYKTRQAHAAVNLATQKKVAESDRLIPPSKEGPVYEGL